MYQDSFCREMLLVAVRAVSSLLKFRQDHLHIVISSSYVDILVVLVVVIVIVVVLAAVVLVVVSSFSSFHLHCSSLL